MRRHKDLDNPAYCKWLDFLRDASRWGPATIKEWQRSMLRQTLCRAAQLPGYHDLWQGILPSPETLPGLPWLTREMLRDRLDDFSLPVEGRYRVSTGGSSGIPISIYRDPESFARELASKAHQYHRVMWREGDRQIVLRGRPQQGIDFVSAYNELRFSSFHLTDEQMEDYWHAALGYEPQWLRCYPSAGYLFAKFLVDRGRVLPLSGVLCASEKLYPFQKRMMRRAFGENARIFSHYGSYELSALAGYCLYADTYHVLPFYGIVELLRPDGSHVTQRGEVGEIVATSFVARATPVVRYKTGDLAVWGGVGCEHCGLPYPIWLDVEGRRWEFVITKTGRKLSPAALNDHGDLYDNLRQFRYHQKERGKVDLLFVPRESGVNVAALYQRVKVQLGDDVDLTVRAVESLPLTTRGKHGFLIQELDVDVDSTRAWGFGEG